MTIRRGGFLYNVRREFSREVIKKVLRYEGIFDAISEDGQEDVGEIDVSGDCFLTLTVNDGVVGVYALRPMSRVELDIHAHIMPPYRKMHAKPLTRMVYQWILDNAPQYQKVTAQIPEMFPNVVAFAEFNGMTREGVNRLSWLKGEKLHDQIRLGITRDEMISFLEVA